MKAAFSAWNDRIAPVFDVARQIWLVEAKEGRILSETEASLSSEPALGKVDELSRLGVEVLVCGAISRFLEGLVAARGIHVVPFVAGDLKDVVNAWTLDQIEPDRSTR
ncbi:dinitrogenase iron-molybdenum cofactor biosynthesis protein [bacterium]|nr:dinitrogenase iron-molybdenum cofactor biosynthesis protein [bacterium]